MRRDLRTFRKRRSVSGRGGFTLVEILIAVFIVSIGLMGVLALVTASLKSSGEIIQDSFASTIARSVYESLRAGARQRSFRVQTNVANSPPQAPIISAGFLFVHDGVLQEGAGGFTGPGLGNFIPPKLPIANDMTALLPLYNSDFAIFLPQGPAPGATNPHEPIFVYPRPDGSGAASFDGVKVGAENAPPGVDDSFQPSDIHPDFNAHPLVYDIRRVYCLFNRPLPPGVSAGTGPQPDALDDYGFAIAIRRASAPYLTDNNQGGINGNPLPWASVTNGGGLDKNLFPPGQASTAAKLGPVDGLYQVEVMVFRNFERFNKANQKTQSPFEFHKSHLPVPGGSFVGLIAIGP
jgi:prepilin-type N-terminal cleavage/methylation domain-containing protein